jgi:CheY-like chemotaxis protein
MQGTHGGKRILLAEDEPAVRKTIALLLGLDGHQVVTAARGDEALALFQAGPFDLVITDYAMPGLYGNELARRIKALLPTQPILMVTAYLERLGDPSNPVDAILHKPFQYAEFRHTLTRLIG